MSDEHFNGMTDALNAVKDPASHPIGAPGSVRRELNDMGLELVRLRRIAGLASKFVTALRGARLRRSDFETFDPLVTALNGLPMSDLARYLDAAKADL